MTQPKRGKREEIDEKGERRREKGKNGDENGQAQICWSLLLEWELKQKQNRK